MCSRWLQTRVFNESFFVLITMAITTLTQSNSGNKCILSAVHKIRKDPHIIKITKYSRISPYGHLSNTDSFLCIDKILIHSVSFIAWNSGEITSLLPNWLGLVCCRFFFKVFKVFSFLLQGFLFTSFFCLLIVRSWRSKKKCRNHSS